MLFSSRRRLLLLMVLLAFLLIFVSLTHSAAIPESVNAQKKETNNEQLAPQGPDKLETPKDVIPREPDEGDRHHKADGPLPPDANDNGPHEPDGPVIPDPNDRDVNLLPDGDQEKEHQRNAEEEIKVPGKRDSGEVDGNQQLPPVPKEGDQVEDNKGALEDSEEDETSEEDPKPDDREEMGGGQGDVNPGHEEQKNVIPIIPADLEDTKDLRKDFDLLNRADPNSLKFHPGKDGIDGPVPFEELRKKFAEQLKGKPISINDLKPPDHLDAVRMEQDGHLNRDYKKEIFLGNHEDLDEQSHEKMVDELTEIFYKIDTDLDRFVSLEELEAWIQKKVQEHFEEAVEQNDAVFNSLDRDHDGYVTWKEFHFEFLKAKGHKSDEVIEQVENYDGVPLDEEDKEEIIRFKFRWAEADEEPQDNKLHAGEFRNFRHPEQSLAMTDHLVDEIIDNLDQNQDEKITEDEFAALPPGESEEEDIDQMDHRWIKERRMEFRESIDLNGDKIVDRDELRKYVDPRNPSHAKMEAENLIELADDIKDGKLSLDEMLDNVDLFFGSKVVDTGRSFHDEF